MLPEPEPLCSLQLLNIAVSPEELLPFPLPLFIRSGFQVNWVVLLLYNKKQDSDLVGRTTSRQILEAMIRIFKIYRAKSQTLQSSTL